MWERWQFLTDDRQFTVQNIDKLYVLVSSTHKTTRRDMTYTVLKVTLKLIFYIDDEENQFLFICPIGNKKNCFLTLLSPKLY